MTSRRTALLVLALAALLVLGGCGRTTAAAPTAAEKDRAALEGLRAIRIGVEQWDVDHGDSHPVARLVVKATTVPHAHSSRPQTVGCYLTGQGSSPAWPTNPFTGRPMQQGTSPGDFIYEAVGPSSGDTYCLGYRLMLYRSDGRPELAFRCGWSDAFAAAMDEIDWLVRDWARHHHGRYPPSSFVARGGIGAAYLDERVMDWPGEHFAWPINPWDGRPIHPGTDPGDYRYRRLSSHRYQLIAFEGAHSRPWKIAG